MQAVPDPLVRFARAHLRNPPRYAVYRTAGSTPDAWWSATEIAQHAGLDIADIDRALRGFAAAGILHERVSPGGRLCRWRDELRYVLDGTSPPAELIDPICGMPVNADSAYTGHDATGATVHFCSRWCQAAHRNRLRRR
ncbi:MAG: hypothetical protein ABI807_07290 [Sporichthyaceae bacterium]